MFAGRGKSDEECDGDVKEFGEAAGVGLADLALSVEDFGGDAGGSEDFEKIALAEGVIVHQRAERFEWGGGWRVVAEFELLDEEGEEFGEGVLLGRHFGEIVELFEGGDEALVFLGGLNDGGAGLLEEVSVGDGVHYSHFFQAPLMLKIATFPSKSVAEKERRMSSRDEESADSTGFIQIGVCEPESMELQNGLADDPQYVDDNGEFGGLQAKCERGVKGWNLR